MDLVLDELDAVQLHVSMARKYPNQISYYTVSPFFFLRPNHMLRRQPQSGEAGI
jgi:hypothetical protein